MFYRLMRSYFLFFNLVTVMLVACTAQTPVVAPVSVVTHGTAHGAAGTVVPITRSASSPPPVAFNLDKGNEIGFVYEAFLSPHQEPADEEDTPSIAPQAFRSTAPSTRRVHRKSRGHGFVRITNDLSRAYVDVKIENINPDDIVLFHIHCGKPDMLGPILVDFGMGIDLTKQFNQGVFTFEVSNEHLVSVANAGHGLVGFATAGCPVLPTLDRIRTIAGMKYVAEQKELYFNLHTKGQTFYGDIRGQLHPITK